MDFSTRSIPFRTISLFDKLSFSAHRFSFLQYSSSSRTRNIVSLGDSLLGRPRVGDIVITSLFVATIIILLLPQKVKLYSYPIFRDYSTIPRRDGGNPGRESIAACVRGRRRRGNPAGRGPPAGYSGRHALKVAKLRAGSRRDISRRNTADIGRASLLAGVDVEQAGGKLHI